jgi:hypothetical protein
VVAINNTEDLIMPKTTVSHLGYRACIRYFNVPASRNNGVALDASCFEVDTKPAFWIRIEGKVNPETAQELFESILEEKLAERAAKGWETPVPYKPYDIRQCVHSLPIDFADVWDLGRYI